MRLLSRPITALALAGAFHLSSLHTPLRAGESFPTIDYSVSVPDPASKMFEVSAMLHGVIQDTTTFYFPIWAPGAYDIVNFGKYVSDFTAVNADGSALTVGHPDSNSFTLAGAKAGDVKIAYKVRSIGLIPNSLWFGLADISPTSAFAVGTALFGYPSGGKSLPYTVHYEVPAGWDIAIGLDPVPGASRNTYRARDYDELVDAPLDMGKVQRYEFMVGGKPHTINLHSPVPFNDSLGRVLVEMTRRIVEQETTFFGEMPYDRYVFQHYLVRPVRGDHDYGALEHRNSSTYRMPYSEQSDIVRELAPVIAHEFWHLWSPKRIHVAQLGPFDYQHPPRTISLWFAEGLTEYYAKLFMLRSGVMDKDRFLREANDEYVSPTFGKSPRLAITDLSVKLPDLPPSESEMLYTKGPVLGMLLDIIIRQRSNGKVSLDDVMRRFNEEYGKSGRTFTDTEIIGMMENFAGVKLEDFYRKYIDGINPIPYADFLPQIGMKIVSKRTRRPTLGAALQMVDKKGLRVLSVVPGGSLYNSGIKAGDILTRLQVTYQGQGVRYDLSEFPSANIDPLFAEIPSELTIDLAVERNGNSDTKRVTVSLGIFDINEMAIDDAAPPAAVELRKKMLNF
ncbi:MAG: peptidase domain protein [Chlorobi bacterium]|nr:peptidase domain protein [Chlorobiota bacterium]